MIKHQINKTTVVATINGKVLIKSERSVYGKKKVDRIYLTQAEAFKLAYKLMSIASEL